MEKEIGVTCECEGTGFIAEADNGGEGVERVECGQHHSAFKDALSNDELIDAIGKQTGISSEFFRRLRAKSHLGLGMTGISLPG